MFGFVFSLYSYSRVPHCPYNFSLSFSLHMSLSYLSSSPLLSASHQMTSNPLPEQGPHKPGSVGKPQGIQLAILDPQCAVLPTGQTGEVCIKGENVTAGYQNNPEANATGMPSRFCLC